MSPDGRCGRDGITVHVCVYRGDGLRGQYGQFLRPNPATPPMFLYVTQSSRLFRDGVSFLNDKKTGWFEILMRKVRESSAYLCITHYVYLFVKKRAARNYIGTIEPGKSRR